jgi:predicted  nucleic acid-binding Zn-ribbon protein
MHVATHLSNFKDLLVTKDAEIARLNALPAVNSEVEKELKEEIETELKEARAECAELRTKVRMLQVPAVVMDDGDQVSELKETVQRLTDQIDSSWLKISEGAQELEKSKQENSLLVDSVCFFLLY